MLTFPSIGYSTILIATLMREWNMDFVCPAEISESTVQKSTAIAPGDACMPFKVVMGSFMESCERGADRGIFFGGCGPCSFGYFSSTINELFSENGIDFKAYTLEFGSDDLKELYAYIKSATNKGALSMLKSAPMGLAATAYLDRFESYMLDIRASIVTPQNREDFNRYEKNCFDKLLTAESFRKMTAMIYGFMLRANSFREKRSDTAFVGIVGDIFSIIDGFSNYNLQKMLADMGVRTRRSMTVSGWIYEKLPFLPDFWKIGSHKYIKKNIGGFARETVGYTALWSRRMDGIIQVFPLNCMPETVAAQVLPVIREKTHTPVLQLCVDECASPEGYRTRAEAFCDMIKRKKAVENANGKGAFSRG